MNNPKTTIYRMYIYNQPTKPCIDWPILKRLRDEALNSFLYQLTWVVLSLSLPFLLQGKPPKIRRAQLIARFIKKDTSSYSCLLLCFLSLRLFKLRNMENQENNRTPSAEESKMQCQNDNNYEIPSSKHHHQREEGNDHEEEQDFLGQFQCPVCL